ncbi:TPA: macrolide ABC transporter ATP-binding protein, partial [Streptococcus pyogenes]
MSHEKKQLMQLSNIVKSYQNGDQVLK